MDGRLQASATKSSVLFGSLGRAPRLRQSRANDEWTEQFRYGRADFREPAGAELLGK
jgi:hypothetical protein